MDTLDLSDLNYRHLRYFWTVAREGGVTAGARRLGLSVQAISTQLGQLERQLGVALFAPAGRSLQLTEAGQVALAYADQIFQLGGKLQQALADSGRSRPRFRVGVTDAVPKLVVFHLLAPVTQPPCAVRLECSEGGFDTLLGALALNQLDLVIADRSAPERANLRLDSHCLGSMDIGLYGCAELHARYQPGFPLSLHDAPLLLPASSDPLRQALNAWLNQLELRPQVVGEFVDSALLKTFGRAGLGLFAAPLALAAELAQQYGARLLGPLEAVSESWYAIATRRQIPHPAISALLAAASLPLAAAGNPANGTAPA
ncbi:MAG: hypothetical protein RIR00_2360 [Pseudomonadota bacterium]